MKLHEKKWSDIVKDECDGEIRSGYVKQWIISMVKELQAHRRMPTIAVEDFLIDRFEITEDELK